MPHPTPYSVMVYFSTSTLVSGQLCSVPTVSASGDLAGFCELKTCSFIDLVFRSRLFAVPLFIAVGEQQELETKVNVITAMTVVLYPRTEYDAGCKLRYCHGSVNIERSLLCAKCDSNGLRARRVCKFKTKSTSKFPQLRVKNSKACWWSA